MKIRDKYKLGNLSKQRLSTVSNYLQMTVEKSMLCTPIDFAVPWMGGLRTTDQQISIFRSGYSKADGKGIISYHQLTDIEGKGLAIDLVPYVNGIDYTASGRFGIIGMLMIEAWEELQNEGEIPTDLYLHWGGFWTHKRKSSLGWDMAHYEIREVEQIERL